eukprot:15366708-Ditylum_brightwellii.AAC.1
MFTVGQVDIIRPSTLVYTFKGVQSEQAMTAQYINKQLQEFINSQWLGLPECKHPTWMYLTTKTILWGDMGEQLVECSAIVR